MIAGNFELGELIRNHREQDVGERAKGRSRGPGGDAWWDWGVSRPDLGARMGPNKPQRTANTWAAGGPGSRRPALSHPFLPWCLPHPTVSCLLCVSPSARPRPPCPSSVPFQESPKYAARRRGPPGTGLTVPPALLRANSDTSMALPDWMVFAAPGTSSAGAPGPTAGPQGQAQPAAPSAKLSSGTLRSASSPRGARARSPSRGRHPEEAKRQPRGRPR